jgi:hypothetical protein
MRPKGDFVLINRSVTALLFFVLVFGCGLAQTTKTKPQKTERVRLHIDGFSKSKSGAI